jgi:hypothetical protein
LILAMVNKSELTVDECVMVAQQFITKFNINIPIDNDNEVKFHFVFAYY